MAGFMRLEEHTGFIYMQQDSYKCKYERAEQKKTMGSSCGICLKSAILVMQSA